MKRLLVFGYGSLINISSLKEDVPEAKSITACYIKGFKREFCIWDPIGWSPNGQPNSEYAHCALTVYPVKNKLSLVNGVVFMPSDKSYKRLLKREVQYVPVTTMAYDFTTDEEIGECIVFSANKHNGVFINDSPWQMHYLNVCLDGARSLGEQFYDQFLDTTFLHDTSLRVALEGHGAV